MNDIKISGLKAAIVLVLVAVFAPLQTESVAVMSIDLGAEFMKVAIVKPGIPMEIVLNKESRRKTPLVVSLRGDEREFGDMAMSQAIKQPKTAYLYITQLLAKSLDNPAVKSYLERYPFYNIKENPDTKTIYFQHDDSTTYTPEELLAMILDYARGLASDFAEQAVDAAVITVPPYFNQAERKAVLRAAEIVNLKVLQLINSNIAAGLNYGVFRRKDFNSTGTTLMFFDVGSTGTVATVATFQLVKLKEDYEANPQLTIRGVGYDRTLGGNAFTLRLAKHLAKLFYEKTKKDVFTNPKATLKIYKEADRVKTVLSANADHMAQVEGLMDDVDFKAKVTREEFEQLCADLFQRVKEPIEDAIKSAEIIREELSSVILVGAGTRIPKIQDELLKATKKSELGKNLNTDEASALGAVYQAAFQSKGYKVKKFYIKDTNIYPVAVDFEKADSDQSSGQNTVRRVLFDKSNQFPQRKVMTFNKHTTDFGFRVNYGDLSYLSEELVQGMGSLNISQVKLSGVADVFAKHKEEESKGIKVHFRLDDSGILRLDKVDISFEKTTQPEESTLSKIGNKISSFFGGLTDDEKVSNPENADYKDSQEGGDKEPTAESSSTKSPAQNETTASANGTDSSLPNNATQPVANLTVVREDILFSQVDLDLIDNGKETIAASRQKLKQIKEKEKEKRKRAAAINSLEAFIFDTRDKLTQEEFVKCSTDAEREKIKNKLEEADLWLSDADFSVPTKEFADRLTELKNISKEVFYRINEKKLRPKRLDELKDVLNKSADFLKNARNLTGEDLPLTEVETTALEKLINSTKEWRVKMMNEQAKVADNEQPKMLSTDIEEKSNNIKREVSYLLNKIKYFRPKTTKKPPTEKSNSTSSKAETDDGKPTNKTDGEKSDENAEKADEGRIDEDMFDKEEKSDETTSTPEPTTNSEDIDPTKNPEL